MKQPKVPNVAAPVAATPAPPPAPRGPRFRYFSNPPSTLTVRLGDLTGGIPSGIRALAFDPERRIEVSCAEIFNGPVPKISLSRLAGIAPECFQTQNFSEAQIEIPAAKLVPEYRLVTTSELIEEPVVVEEELAVFAPPEETPPAAEVSEPVATPPIESAAPQVEHPSPQGINEPAAAPDAVLLIPPMDPRPSSDAAPVVPIPPVEPPAPPPAAPVVFRKPFIPATKTKTAPVEPVQPPPAAVEVPPPPTPSVAPRAAAIPQARRSFSLLPIFRRKEADPKNADIPAPPAPRTRVEIPKPKAPLSPLVPPVLPPVVENASVPAPVFEPPVPPPATFSPIEEPPVVESPEAIAIEAEPTPVSEETPPIEKAPEPAPQSEAVLVETEHLPVAVGKDSVEIPNQDALQAIFMTEEFLAVDRVVELCGGLPGIKSCVLSHGSAVLASHNVPDSIDLVSLSAHAVEMLSGMRASSAKMGIGAVPAVTVHSDKGPITFFHQDDLCLLVMHKDRGFIPGVREKLQQVVEELSRANLPLPVSSARPALEKWK